MSHFSKFRRAKPLLFVLALLSSAQATRSADLMHFWDEPRKGGNSFNEAVPDQAYFDALAATGATWVRLTYSKWKGKGRDFLLGNADHYSGLAKEDLKTLRKALDAANAAGLKVVVAPLSLPGARWVQQNGGKFDDRLWSDEAYADQAVRFWTDLAVALKDHPAIAAYNIVNEPAPERKGGLAENASMQENLAWQKLQSGGPRDLRRFYEKVIAAIRKVDPVTPVMVDSGWYANPRMLATWNTAFNDERVLYAFHMYEPYEATSAPNMKRSVPLRYPGVETEYDGGKVSWDRTVVGEHIGAAFDWAASHGLKPTRVVAAEFGCMRLWADCATYLGDVTDAIQARGGHWAFYSFREDVWEGMDYELPKSVKPGQFYWLSEQGKADDLPRNGKLMNLLKAKMQD